MVAIVLYLSSAIPAAATVPNTASASPTAIVDSTPSTGDQSAPASGAATTTGVGSGADATSTPGAVSSTGTSVPTAAVPDSSAQLGDIANFVTSLVGVTDSADTNPGLGGFTPATCDCSVAVAMSIGADAVAVADPGASGSALTGGSATGTATSLSVSGAGAATAQAQSGRPGGVIASSAAVLAPPTVLDANSADAPALEVDVHTLIGQLLSANTQSTALGAAVLDAMGSAWTPGANSDAHGVAVEVSFEAGGTPSGASGPADASWCGSVTGLDAAQWCAVAISISFGATAHASVVGGPSAATPTAPTSTTSALCSRPFGGLAGGATAIAISTGGLAQATAQRGSSESGTCAPISTASSGVTGNALSLALTEGGIAASVATSGDSGAVEATAPAGSGAAATSGATGDAVGIAIADLGAVSVVQSGNSGTASADCAGCNVAVSPLGGDAVAIAISGHTGTSYSLAVAGLQATVHALSGNSGNAVAVSTGGPAGAGAGAGTLVAGAPGGGLVVGQSGDTGNTVAIAVGPSTWVAVTTKSGNAGSVTSTVSRTQPSASPTTGASAAPVAPPAGPAVTTPDLSVGPSSIGVVSVVFGAQAGSPEQTSTSSIADPATSPVQPAGNASNVLNDPPLAPASFAVGSHGTAIARLIAPVLVGAGFIVLGLILPLAVLIAHRRKRHT